jgi:predicted nucleic acid-binding Zn finger protein
VDQIDQFQLILKEIRDSLVISEECEHKIELVFSREQFLKAQEILTLKQIALYQTIELKRKMWIINRPDHKYIVYPLHYCSCMDFYLHSIIKNTKYLCKHLIAQALYEQLNIKELEKNFVGISEDDLRNLVKEALEL